MHGPFGTRDAKRRREEAVFAKAKRTSRPVYLRRERRPEWKGSLPLYVLWCEDCGIHTVTHPAGYGRIHCSGCRRRERVMTWARFRDKQAWFLLYAIAALLLLLSWYLGR